MTLEKDSTQSAYTKERVNIEEPKPYCPYCNIRDHFLGAVQTFFDDSADRYIVLPQAVQCLGLTAIPENISLRTVRQDIVQVNGASASFEISPINRPTERHDINGAFTAENLGLSEHT